MDIQTKQEIEKKKVDEVRLVKTHFPKEALPTGKQGQMNFGMAVILHVNYDYTNVLPTLIRQRDYGTVSSFVTTALCIKWLYNSKRPVYSIDPSGKLLKVPETNGMSMLKGMCKSEVTTE